MSVYRPAAAETPTEMLLYLHDAAEQWDRTGDALPPTVQVQSWASDALGSTADAMQMRLAAHAIAAELVARLRPSEAPADPEIPARWPDGPGSPQEWLRGLLWRWAPEDRPVILAAIAELRAARRTEP